MKTRAVSDTELKAKFSALLKEVEQNRAPISITRQGQVVAILTPWKAPKSKLAGKDSLLKTAPKR